MIGFDEWRAADRARFRTERWRWSWKGRGCKGNNNSLGDGSQSAKREDASQGGMSSSSWNYSGLPGFYDLSAEALSYTPGNANENKRDPRLKFAIRLTREKTLAKTSVGRSEIKPQGTLQLYQGSEAGDVLAAVATSEVFFERPVARADGSKELASLFNPYWQVHLITTSAADMAAAKNKQVGAAP